MFCPACGSRAEAGSEFCKLCGKSLRGKDATLLAKTGAAPAPVHPQSVAGHGHVPTHLVQSLENRLRRLAGTERLEGFSLSDFFSEVFKRHTPEQMDEYFVTGTTRTTPRIEDIPTGWPKPWFFFRVLMFVVALYLLFDYVIIEFGASNAIPGLMVMGSLAIPLAVLVLLFELNVLRDVSFVGVLALFSFGAITGFIFTEFVTGLVASSLSWMGNSVAGIVEEIAKLLAVCVIVGRRKHRFILNGILFGGAVGAGFAAFESMGYAFGEFRDTFMIATANHIQTAISNTAGVTVRDILVFLQTIIDDPNKLHPDADALSSMVRVIQLRGWLSPFGHVAWTAIAAAGLWRIKGARDLEMRMFFNRQFLGIFMIPVTLHMIWDMPWISILSKFMNHPPDWPVYVLYTFLGLVSWFILMGLVQQGLRQIKDEQIVLTRSALAEAKPGTDSGGGELAPSSIPG